jgi:hypothetical protein
LEVPPAPAVLYFNNRATDDLPPLIVGNAIWETFPAAQQPSYWLQYTERFGTSLEFINDQWYNIFWSSSYNSYYVHEGQKVKEPEYIGLGTLARFLEEQETTEGEECNRQMSLSTSRSETQPASRRNPIQGNIGDSSSEIKTRTCKVFGAIHRSNPYIRQTTEHNELCSYSYHDLNNTRSQ